MKGHQYAYLAESICSCRILLLTLEPFSIIPSLFGSYVGSSSLGAFASAPGARRVTDTARTSSRARRKLGLRVAIILIGFTIIVSYGQRGCDGAVKSIGWLGDLNLSAP
jgi:hypothetical protein